MSHAFQVDLRGVVDLFSRHLYSSPRVYLRELLQNGVDAITARQACPYPLAREQVIDGSQIADPATPTIRLSFPAAGGLEVWDNGIGLTYDEAGELLATIGRSSKRQESLEEARGDYIGQFGIGLLSAFMVAETIEMTSRSAADPTAPPVRWLGHADGTYELDFLATDDPAAPAGAGSIVRLLPRDDQAHWLEPETVIALAEDFGSLLGINVSVEVVLPDGEKLWRRLTLPELPWLEASASETARAARMSRYCEQTLGFTPLAWFDLDLPAIGLTGAAFVLPQATSPAAESSHRVYLKKMLLGTQVTNLLPEWAFFVRCVVNTAGLRPTASREALYEDEIMVATREALGERIMAWTIATLSENSMAQEEFVRIHNLALRSLALHNNTILELVAQVLPYETTIGPMTLAEAYQAEGRIRYVTTVQDYRRIAPVAAAQGLAVVNGGYVYDADLLQRLAARKPEWQIEELAAADVDHALDPLDPAEELAYLDFLSVARDALAEVDCEPIVRQFAPDELPALLVTDAEIEHQKELERTRDQVGGIWGGILEQFSRPTAQRRLVLNSRAEAVQALSSGGDVAVQEAGAQTLYVTARLLAGEPLRAGDAVMMNQALGTLVKQATSGRDTPQPD